MKEKRVVKFYFKENSKLNRDDYDLFVEMTKESVSIYNYANYIVRQKFFSKQENNKYDFSFVDEHEELKPLFEKYLEEEHLFTSTLYLILSKWGRINNLNLNSKMINGIYRRLDRDWKSFFSLLKKKKDKNYDKKVSIPNYKKEKHSLVEFGKQTISKRLLKNEHIGIAKCKEGIKIPKFLSNYEISSFRANFKKGRLIIEVLYDKDIEVHKQKKLLKNKRTASIDLGVNQLATITFNFNHRPIVVSGKDIKSINQFYNKNLAKEESKLPKNVLWSKKLDNITLKRELRLHNLIHYKTNRIIELFKKLDIEQVVVGKNKEWKSNINIGKRNNQTFTQIPFEKFVNTLEYKLREIKLFMCRQEESYTSKANFLANDFIPVYEKGNEESHKFTGRRVSRGLYKDRTSGKVIHADVNGSLNIMRKAEVNIIEPSEFLNKNNIIPLNIEKVA